MKEQSKDFIRIITYINSNIQTLLSTLALYDEQSMIIALKKHIADSDGREPSYVSLTNSGTQSMDMAFTAEEKRNQENDQWNVYCSPDVYYEFSIGKRPSVDKIKTIVDLLIESPTENVNNKKSGYIYTDVIADITQQFALRKEQKVDDRPLTLMMDTSMHSLGTTNLAVLLNEFKTNLDEGTLKIVVAHSLNKYSQVGLDSLASGCLYVFSNQQQKELYLFYGSSGLAGYKIHDRTPQILTHMLLYAQNHLRAYQNFSKRTANDVYAIYKNKLPPESKINIHCPNHSGSALESIQSSFFSHTGLIYQYFKSPPPKEEKNDEKEEQYADPHLNTSWGFLCVNRFPFFAQKFLSHWLNKRDGYGFAETTWSSVEASLRISFGTEPFSEVLKKIKPTLDLCRVMNCIEEQKIDSQRFDDAYKVLCNQLDNGEIGNESCILDLIYHLEKNPMLQRALKAAQEGDVNTLSDLSRDLYLPEVKNIFGMTLEEIVKNKLSNDPNNILLKEALSIITSCPAPMNYPQIGPNSS